MLCPVNAINARSVKNKTAKIYALIEELNLDILMITETWLNGDIDKPVVVDMTPGTHSFYGIHRTSASRDDEARGGGFGVIISNSFKNVTKRTFPTYKSFESMSLSFTAVNKNLNVISIYPPLSSNKNDFIDEFRNLVDSLPVDNTEYIFVGDCNIWVDVPGDHYGDKFLKKLCQFSDSEVGAHP